MILLWLPQARVWQTLGYVKVASREEALEQGLTLEGCPAASERPALSAVPLRYWQPFIASPPPPPDGHEWKPFVPAVEDATWSPTSGIISDETGVVG